MQNKHDNKQNLTRLRFGSAEHRVEVAQEEEGRGRESEGYDCEVEDCRFELVRRLSEKEMRGKEDSLPQGLQATRDTAIQTKFAYPYKQAHSIKFALSLPYHLSTPHSPTGTNAVYPYTSPAAPLNNLKSYAKCSSPFCARYWLIVPVKNRMTMTVVAIHTGP